MNLLKIFSLITIFTVSCILQASEQSTTMHSINQITQEQNYEPVNLQAQDFPQIEEGFALCGRYNLQEFFDRKLQELRAADHQDELFNDADTKKINTMSKNILHHNQAIAAAEKLIADIFMNDTISQDKFCTMLKDIIDNDLDLNLDPAHFTPSLFSRFWLKTPAHIADQFFQYCKNAKFMAPAVKKYIISYEDNEKYYNIQCVGIDSKQISEDQLAKQFMSFIPKIIKKDNAPVLQFLFDQGISPKNDNLLIYALDQEAYKCIETLVKAGNDVNCLNPCFHQIIDNYRDEEKNINTISVLLHTGIDPNLKHENGNTCLHRATQQKRTKLIPLLIACGANLHATNYSGKTPWDVAPSQEIRDLLIPASVTTTNPNEHTSLLQQTKIGSESEAMTAQSFIDYVCCKKIKKN